MAFHASFLKALCFFLSIIYACSQNNSYSTFFTNLRKITVDSLYSNSSSYLIKYRTNLDKMSCFVECSLLSECSLLVHRNQTCLLYNEYSKFRLVSSNTSISDVTYAVYLTQISVIFLRTV